MRLDLLLVKKKLASSRSHAQEIIKAGQVFQILGENKIPLSKSSLNMDENTQLEVEQGPANRFVSRGGLKLEGALKHAGLNVQGLRVLDIGTSTGGFADCLIKSGADFVFGVDVGQGQLHAELSGHPRFQMLEETNARDLSKNTKFLDLLGSLKFDLVVMDVSFISISLILPELVFFLKKSGLVLSLVKPQFEVGAENLGRGGIVKDVSLYPQVEAKIRSVAQAVGLDVRDYFNSSIEGKDGNREFFLYAQKN